MTDITYCSANEQVCPMTAKCVRGEWRDNPTKTFNVFRQSFADFSEEMTRKPFNCPFYMTKQ